jgi:hypothetical protein
VLLAATGHSSNGLGLSGPSGRTCVVSNLNCGPISVTPGDGWRSYVSRVPDGWLMLGTVHRKRGHVGALARSPRGELFCMRGASLERLVQDRAEAALAKALAEASTAGGSSP